MSDDHRPDVTRILQELCQEGAQSPEVTDRLYEAVYDELRRIAARLMKSERADHTLQPTALVHEAYLRLVDQTKVEWRCRAHFFAVAARVMRRILVDHARRRTRQKRGGGEQRVTWNEDLGLCHSRTHETLALDRALARLAELDPRMERVVELRVFGGLTIREVAYALGISTRTVDGDWMVAKGWLAREFTRE
ncbi:MAG: sigma-70 family RNA polymerase sigma factor [Candidatus Eisenbacteria bacterium]|nr:sigma-70 family RNA polymerase sigma factor [Candidatus Eisenbacteria bacterium]